MREVEELVEPAKTVSSDESVSRAVSAMKSAAARAVAVVEGGQLLGVIDGRCLLDFHDNADKTKCRSVAQKTPPASARTTPEELVMQVLNTNARAIPFVENGVLKGVIPRNSCLKLLANSSGVRERRVADFMSHPNASVQENTLVQQARKKMRELGVYHLAITGAGGNIAGVVSSYDIAVQVIPHQREGFREGTFAPTPEAGVELEPVSSIMHAVPEVTTPDAPLKNAIKQMVDKKVSALVVVERGKPCGLLSVRDCLHAVLKPTPEPVFVYGLREDEKAMAESIRGLGSAFLEKLDRKIPADYLALHVKSFKEGKKRRYAVKGKLSVKGRLHSASTPETSSHRSVWDLNASVKEVLAELSRIASDREHSRPRSLKRRNAEGKAEEE